MQIQELKCFGEHAGSGNRALVIEGDRLDEAGRQALAVARNTTCVFVDGTSEPDVGCVLDYFYPHMRSPLCLHATLAAARVLFARQPSYTPVTVQTAMRSQRLVLSLDEDAVYASLERQSVPQMAIASWLPARLLGAPGLVPVTVPRIASVGSPKLLIEVADTAALYSLQPDLDAIAAWGKQHGVNGIYAWCRLSEGHYEGRNFNHLDPKLEDSATGVAAGALSALLGHDLMLRQGHATGSTCLIRTKVHATAIQVGGRAEFS